MSHHVIFANEPTRQPLISALQLQGVIPNDPSNIDLPMQPFVASIIDELVIPSQHDWFVHLLASLKAVKLSGSSNVPIAGVSRHTR